MAYHTYLRRLTIPLFPPLQALPGSTGLISYDPLNALVAIMVDIGVSSLAVKVGWFGGSFSLFVWRPVSLQLPTTPD